jgi:hypothetical protein
MAGVSEKRCRGGMLLQPMLTDRMSNLFELRIVGPGRENNTTKYAAAVVNHD